MRKSFFNKRKRVFTTTPYPLLSLDSWEMQKRGGENQHSIEMRLSNCRFSLLLQRYMRRPLPGNCLKDLLTNKLFQTERFK